MSRTSLVLISVLSVLYACSTEKAPNDTGTNETAPDTTTEDTSAPLLTSAELEGVWSSTVCEAYDDGNGGTNYLTRTFSLTAARWALDLTVYGDAGCTYGLFQVAIEGPYTLGGEAVVAGATNGDFGFASNRWTALAADMVGVFNQAGCGAGGWEVGVSQDVTSTGCIGVAHPVEDCPVEYDIVALDGDDLYLGARVTDMCVEEGRPTALGPYPVVRR
jgi:hypothetical protein